MISMETNVKLFVGLMTSGRGTHPDLQKSKYFGLFTRDGFLRKVNGVSSSRDEIVPAALRGSESNRNLVQKLKFIDN